MKTCSLFVCFLQASLTTLMDRIAKAEPFFIFCVRANAEKVICESVASSLWSLYVSLNKKRHHFFFFFFCLFKQKELCFDDKLVLNQIRYTGLLQIVHIQKSGYSAKYTFEVGTRFNVILLINVYK